MGNYEQLKQSVSNVIKTNGNQEITGSILHNVLLTIISTVGANATFAGIATPTTNPGTPDGPVFYLTSESGTYTNFNAIELQDGLSVLLWNGSWSSQQIFSVDDVPTAGSDNLVKSGGIEKCVEYPKLITEGATASILHKGWLNSTKISEFSTGTHIVVPVKPNDELFIVANSAYNSFFAIVKSYTLPITDYNLDFCEDYPNRITVNTNRQSNKIIIPSDANYIIVAYSYLSGNELHFPQNIFINGIDIANGITSSFDSVNELKKGLANNVILLKKFSPESISKSIKLEQSRFYRLTLPKLNWSCTEIYGNIAIRVSLVGNNTTRSLIYHDKTELPIAEGEKYTIFKVPSDAEYTLEVDYNGNEDGAILLDDITNEMGKLKLINGSLESDTGEINYISRIHIAMDNLLPISELKNIKCFTPSLYYFVYCFYDSNNNFISSTKNQRIIPENSVFFRIGYRKVDFSKINIEEDIAIKYIDIENKADIDIYSKEFGFINDNGAELYRNYSVRLKNFISLNKLSSIKLISASNCHIVYYDESFNIIKKDNNLTNNPRIYPDRTITNAKYVKLYFDSIGNSAITNVNEVTFDLEINENYETTNEQKVNSSIFSNIKRAWPLNEKNNTYEAWPFNNCFYDSEDGSINLAYNSRPAHASEYGEVYFRKKLEYADSFSKPILVSGNELRNGNNIGKRVHASGVCKNGDYIILVVFQLGFIPTNPHNTDIGEIHVFRSTNKGASWTDTGIMTIDGVQVIANQACSLFKASDGTLITYIEPNQESTPFPNAVEVGFIAYSTDNGVTWNKAAKSGDFAENDWLGMEGSFVEIDGIIYVVCRKGKGIGGFYKSVDYGRTWTVVLRAGDNSFGLPGTNYAPTSMLYNEFTGKVLFLIGDRAADSNGGLKLRLAYVDKSKFISGYIGSTSRTYEPSTEIYSAKNAMFNDFSYCTMCRTKNNVIYAFFYMSDYYNTSHTEASIYEMIGRFPDI